MNASKTVKTMGVDFTEPHGGGDYSHQCSIRCRESIVSDIRERNMPIDGYRPSTGLSGNPEEVSARWRKAFALSESPSRDSPRNVNGEHQVLPERSSTRRSTERRGCGTWFANQREPARKRCVRRFERPTPRRLFTEGDSGNQSFLVLSNAPGYRTLLTSYEFRAPTDEEYRACISRLYRDWKIEKSARNRRMHMDSYGR